MLDAGIRMASTAEEGKNLRASALQPPAELRPRFWAQAPRGDLGVQSRRQDLGEDATNETLSATVWVACLTSSEIRVA